MFFKIKTKHLSEYKEDTKHLNIESFLNPKMVYFPFEVGDEQLVKVGDKVARGEAIIQKNGNYPYVQHSSISGNIIGIKKMWHSSGRMLEMLVIENDFLESTNYLSFDENNLSKGMIVDIIKNAGIVGLGGAGFPTYIKYDNFDSINTIILNGVECEPYLTCDYRLLNEELFKIIKGLNYLMKASNAEKGIIVVKKTKVELIEMINSQLIHYPKISLVTVKDAYPVGWEKYLVQAVTKKTYQYLPKEVGVIINNVQTAYAVCEAIDSKLALTEKVITITGDGIRNAKNLRVKIGTSIQEIVEYCGGYTETAELMIVGGPMTGNCCLVDQLVITANVSGVIVKKMIQSKSENCIGCGKCAINCPVKLAPTVIKSAFIAKDLKLLKKLDVMRCIGCGLCSYVCPSLIEITDTMKKAKQMLLDERRKG